MAQQSKQERLEAELATLKAKFEARKKELTPLIEAEDAEREGLKKAAAKAEDAHREAYDAFRGARRAARVELPPDLAVHKAAVAWLASKGLSEASVERVMRSWFDKHIERHPEVQKAKERYEETVARQQSASRAYSKMSLWYSAPRKLLRSLEEQIADKEAELAKLPMRAERAKALRAERAKEERQEKQTEEALKILDTFDPLK